MTAASLPAAAASPGFDAGDPVAALRQRLAGTGDRPRRFVDIDLPAGLQQLLTPQTLAGLKPSAVLIPILRHAQGDTILLTRRADTLRNHTGQISFPGGRRDEGDASLAATALREAFEEVGLPSTQVEILGYLDDYPTLTGYRITPVVGLVTPPFVARIDPGEVAEVFELPLAEMLTPDRFTLKSLKRGELSVPFHELQYGDFRIWGATAAILWQLRGLLLDEGPAGG